MFECGDDSRYSTTAFELAIQEAGAAAVVDPQLRPRVLEAAAQEVNRTRRCRKVGIWIAAALLFCIVMNVCVVKASQWAQRETGLRSQELLSLACRISAESGCGLDWGMVDVLQSIRQSNARAVGSQPAKFIALPK